MLRDYWYISCASNRLRNVPVPTRILDKDLVIYRDNKGLPNALLDRCCHRGVKLSIGEVINGNLVCRYHGWRYNGSGRCVYLPSLCNPDDPPVGITVPSYPCVEKFGYVWVWMGDGESILERLPEIDDFHLHRWYQGSQFLHCEMLKCIENNLDWCHPYFTHPWTHGAYFFTKFKGFKVQEYEVRITDSGMVVFSPPTSSEADPIPTGSEVKITFRLPSAIKVEFRKPVYFVIHLNVVPVSTNTCRLEWLVKKVIPLGRRVKWSKKEPRLFVQDKEILESAQATYDREQPVFERSVEADFATLTVRNIVKLAANGLWDEKKLSLPNRRIITVRS